MRKSLSGNLSLHAGQFSEITIPHFLLTGADLVIKRAIANQIPRRCGSFYWRQAHNALGAGATMIYNAMFDEVDEGTAMFKLAPTTDTVPMLPHVVTLDAEGCRLPNDWYLNLAGQVSAAIASGRSIDAGVPMAK